MDMAADDQLDDGIATLTPIVAAWINLDS